MFSSKRTFVYYVIDFWQRFISSERIFVRSSSFFTVIFPFFFISTCFCYNSNKPKSGTIRAHYSCSSHHNKRMYVSNNMQHINEKSVFNFFLQCVVCRAFFLQLSFVAFFTKKTIKTLNMNKKVTRTAYILN